MAFLPELHCIRAAFPLPAATDDQHLLTRPSCSSCFPGHRMTASSETTYTHNNRLIINWQDHRVETTRPTGLTTGCSSLRPTSWLTAAQSGRYCLASLLVLPRNREQIRDARGFQDHLIKTPSSASFARTLWKSERSPLEQDNSGEEGR